MRIVLSTGGKFSLNQYFKITHYQPLRFSGTSAEDDRANRPERKGRKRQGITPARTIPDENDPRLKRLLDDLNSSTKSSKPGKTTENKAASTKSQPTDPEEELARRFTRRLILGDKQLIKDTIKRQSSPTAIPPTKSNGIWSELARHLHNVAKFAKPQTVANAFKSAEWVDDEDTVSPTGTPVAERPIALTIVEFIRNTCGLSPFAQIRSPKLPSLSPSGIKKLPAEEKHFHPTRQSGLYAMLAFIPAKAANINLPTELYRARTEYIKDWCENAERIAAEGLTKVQPSKTVKRKTVLPRKKFKRTTTSTAVNKTNKRQQERQASVELLQIEILALYNRARVNVSPRDLVRRQNIRRVILDELLAVLRRGALKHPMVILKALPVIEDTFKQLVKKSVFRVVGDPKRIRPQYEVFGSFLERVTPANEALRVKAYDLLTKKDASPNERIIGRLT